jgi:hypothetical protein
MKTDSTKEKVCVEIAGGSCLCVSHGMDSQHFGVKESPFTSPSTQTKESVAISNNNQV